MVSSRVGAFSTPVTLGRPGAGVSAPPVLKGMSTSVKLEGAEDGAEIDNGDAPEPPPEADRRAPLLIGAMLARSGDRSEATSSRTVKLCAIACSSSSSRNAARSNGALRSSRESRKIDASITIKALRVDHSAVMCASTCGYSSRLLPSFLNAANSGTRPLKSRLKSSRN